MGRMGSDASSNNYEYSDLLDRMAPAVVTFEDENGVDGAGAYQKLASLKLDYNPNNV